MPKAKSEATKTGRRSKPYIEDVPEGTEDGSNAPTASPRIIPLPGVTERKKEPIQTPKKSRPRKLLSPEELSEQETVLKGRYPHLVKGTLINATKGGPIPGLVQALTPDEITKFRHKRSCAIKCTCGIERRIATSDLAQVKLCPNCTRDERNRRKRDRRATAAAKIAPQ